MRRRTITGSLVAGLVLVAALVLTAVLAPVFLTGAAVHLTPALRQGPSAAHWFGTDEFGRDIFARALVATRLTLVMAASATAMSAVAGVIIGAGVWMLPRLLRSAILRIVDATVAFPALVLGLVIAAILGPGSVSAVVAIGVAGIPSFARLAANLAGSIVQRDFMVASRLLGVSGGALFARHLLPNIGTPLLMVTTSSFALTLLDISSLSFVGLGVQSPQFDFGRVLQESLASIYVQPWGTVAPSVMLVVAGIAVMLLGDGIAARLDPRLTGGRRSAAAAHATSASSVPEEPDAVLEVADLTVTTPQGAVLVDGVSLTVGAGEVVALVGESGSGKSTTAMAVAGLLADGLVRSADRLRLRELDLLRGAPAKRLATEMGLVFQDPTTTYNPALRMGSQLGEVARVHLGLSRSATRDRVLAALTSVRIREPERRLRQHPHELSGGMLQRGTIATAMLTDPVLLIADEPTTALDVTVQAEVLRQFRRLNRENGTAILFISHDLAVVEALCDRVLVMQKGRIIERLTAAQLRAGDVRTDYARQLLAATPRFEDAVVGEDVEGSR
jgi:peptide/nickel transport system permease protein